MKHNVGAVGVKSLVADSQQHFYHFLLQETAATLLNFGAKSLSIPSLEHDVSPGLCLTHVQQVALLSNEKRPDSTPCSPVISTTCQSSK